MTEDKRLLPPSKSQRKRDMHALQAVGEKLAHLNSQQLAEMPISEKFREAITEFKRISSHEAKRRQLQYLGRLMRDEDVEEIKVRLASLENVSVQAAKELHDLENWRERLLTQSKEALTEFINQFPNCDIQQLRHLIRDASKEKETGKPAGAGRALFRYLRTVSHV